jgi:hypothetical protein
MAAMADAPEYSHLTGFDNLHKVAALNTGASITFSKAWVPKSATPKSLPSTAEAEFAKPRVDAAGTP